MYELRHPIDAQYALKTSDAWIMFPALKTLEFHSVAGSMFHRASNPVAEFIVVRIAHGHGIERLDCTRDIRDVLPTTVCLEKDD